MKVLGIDTSGYANAVGVADDGQILADFVFEAKADSLGKIVPNIDFVLREAKLNLRDIDGFGVGLGPGSWTGIRIGVTVAKILAYSLGKPVCGVPTLEVLAYQAGKMPHLICPIINAGARDTVYAAFYRAENNAIYRIGEYYVGDVPGLARMVKEPVVLVGAEAPAYRQQISQALDSPGVDIFAVEEVSRGSIVASLAQTRFERGESDNVLSLAPLYLKESTARAFLGRYARSAPVKG